jgi:hypothetical protein
MLIRWGSLTFDALVLGTFSTLYCAPDTTRAELPWLGAGFSDLGSTVTGLLDGISIKAGSTLYP